MPEPIHDQPPFQTERAQSRRQGVVRGAVCGGKMVTQYVRIGGHNRHLITACRNACHSLKIRSEIALLYHHRSVRIEAITDDSEDNDGCRRRSNQRGLRPPYPGVMPRALLENLLV